MLNSIKYLLCLAFCLAGLVACGPFPDAINIGNDTEKIETRKENWDSVIWQHNGKALVETWVGRAAVNVGDVTGEHLYDITKSWLSNACGSNKEEDCHSVIHSEQTVEIVKNKFPELQWSTFQMSYTAQFSHDSMRQQLLEQMARTMQALTSTAENCYTVPGHNVMCNVGNFIHINYPNFDGKQNWIRLNIGGGKDNVWMGFRCCRSLNKVDEVTDAAKENIKALGFKQDYSRDAKCLIAYQTTCGECGASCDGCGIKCPDACPKGKCP